MDTLYWIAIAFLILQVLVVVKNIDSKKYYNFFWFCDFAPVLFAIAFFTDRTQFAKSLINIGLMGQMLAILTIPTVRISEWKQGKLLHGRIYFLTEFLIHTTALIALIVTFKAPPAMVSLKYSAITLSTMFIVTLAFVPKKNNVNAVYTLDYDYSSERPKKIKLPFHTSLWLFYALLMATITFLIQYILYIYL